METQPKRAYFDMHVVRIEPEEIQVQDDEVDTTTNSDDQKRDQLRLSKYRYPPFFIVFISIFQLVTFVYYALRADEQLTATGPVPFSSKLIYNPSRRYEIWRYLTYGLIHTGYYHIIFNMIIQLSVGIPLEILHKFEPIAIIYLGGVLGGSLANSIADPHSYLAGASSGCYALIASHFSNLIINWRFLKAENPRFSLATLILFCFTDFGVAVYERHFKPGTLGWRISYSGHLAGAVSGILLGFIFLKRYQTHRFELFANQYSRFITIILFVSKISVKIKHKTNQR